MKRSLPQDDLPGQDSFLDIVANMVGILIILVMVVGVRATGVTHPSSSNHKPTAPQETTSPSSDEIQMLHSETSQLASQVLAVEQEVLLRHRERAELNLYVATLEQELEQERQSLDREDRERLQLQAELDAARRRLEELTVERMALDAETPTVETIESLPTPLAQTVQGDELHLRLSGGRVSVIPVETLLVALRSDAELNLWKLEDNESATGMVGPIEGFRMRYRLAKGPYATRSASGQVERGTVIRLERWELLAAEPDIGEPLPQALMPNSQLFAAIGRANPERTTVTIWTYSDSFSEFRQLKKMLFERGFATAGRPLPDGVKIAGSPNGSRSAAQ